MLKPKRKPVALLQVPSSVEEIIANLKKSKNIFGVEYKYAGFTPDQPALPSKTRRGQIVLRKKKRRLDEEDDLSSPQLLLPRKVFDTPIALLCTDTSVTFFTRDYPVVDMMCMYNSVAMALIARGTVTNEDVDSIAASIKAAVILRIKTLQQYPPEPILQHLREDNKGDETTAELAKYYAGPVMATGGILEIISDLPGLKDMEFKVVMLDHSSLNFFIKLFLKSDMDEYTGFLTWFIEAIKVTTENIRTNHVELTKLGLSIWYFGYYLGMFDDPPLYWDDTRSIDYTSLPVFGLPPYIPPTSPDKMRQRLNTLTNPDLSAILDAHKTRFSAVKQYILDPNIEALTADAPPILFEVTNWHIPKGYSDRPCKVTLMLDKQHYKLLGIKSSDYGDLICACKKPEVAYYKWVMSNILSRACNPWITKKTPPLSSRSPLVSSKPQKKRRVLFP